MLKLQAKAIAFSFLFIFLLQAKLVHGESRVLLDQVVASVGGEPLTDSDLSVNSLAESKKAKSRKKMIEKQLIEKEAARLGIVVDDKAVDLYIDQVRKQNGLDSEKFEELLESQGYSMESYKLEVQGEVLKSRIIAAEVRPKIQVPESEIDKYIAENKETMPSPGSVNIVRIDFSCTEASCDNDSLRSQVETMRGEVLEKNSSNPELSSLFILAKERELKVEPVEMGYLKIKDLRSELSTVLSGLEDGELSSPELLDGKLSIFQIRGRSDDQGKVTGVIRDEIRNKLVSKRLGDEAVKYFSTTLPERYNVSVISQL